MSVPPKFADIGKSANDLLSKDYPIGVAKLEVKTTTANGVCFTVNGSEDTKTQTIVGDLKTKYVDKKNGLTFTNTWTSTNILGLEAESADKLVSGLKLSFNGSLLPASGAKNAKVSAEYKQDHVFSNAALDLFKGPAVFGDVTLGADGFVVGGEIGYNVHDGKLGKYAAAVGYSGGDFGVALHGLGNFNTFSASYFHRVNPDLEAGAKAVWDRKSSSGTVAIELGSKYTFDKDTSVKAKVNNGGIVGLSLTQVIRSGFKLTLGGSFDTTRFNDSVHKLGFSVAFEA